jgi:hypothetical protein
VLSSLPDCESSPAALAGVAAGAAPSDGAVPLGGFDRENWFPGFEVRFELLPTERLPLDEDDGAGEVTEEFAG